MESKDATERPTVPNPRRVAAGKRNRTKWRGFTAQGRERLRQSALALQPWKYSTGPRTAAGKARVAQNGKVRQKGELSTRRIARELREINRLLRDMGVTRRLVREGSGLLG